MRHPFQYITSRALISLNKNRDGLSTYEQAKAFRRLRVSVLNWIRDIVLISGGIFSAAFGLQSFLLPNSFIDGGATGISLLVNHLSHIPLAILLVLINMPFIVIGATNINRTFAIKTA